jgi:hypothetical protein
VNADDAAIKATLRRMFAASDALKRGDAVIPIEAGRLVRDRGPGAYEKAVQMQQLERRARQILDASRRAPVRAKSR